MKEEGDIKRRYQHPDAVSYTPECKDGLMLLIKPSFSFANMRASALSHHQKCTSVYTFDGEFQLTLKHRFCLNQRHPCRCWNKYSTYQYRHGGRWFHTESSSHCELAAQECTGCTFLGVSAGVFCTLLASVPPICKRLTAKRLFSKTYSALLRRSFSEVRPCTSLNTSLTTVKLVSA